MKIVAFLLALLVLAPPAHADGIDGTRKWSEPTVCVESHVKEKVWHVKAALRQWNKAAGPDFVLADDCFGAGVRVQTSSAKPGYSGWTQLEWSGDVLTAAWVTFYPREMGQLRGKQLKCFRAHTVAHELGHALGLAHYPSSHAGAVMSYLDPFKRCGKLSHFDQKQLESLYA